MLGDYESGNIYKFTPDGTPSVFASGLNFPFALAFDSADDLFVSSGDNSNDTDTIIEITAGGVQSTFASGLTPVGLAIQPVPEPSTLGLLAFGVTALLVRSRRKR